MHQPRGPPHRFPSQPHTQSQGHGNPRMGLPGFPQTAESYREDVPPEMMKTTWTDSSMMNIPSWSLMAQPALPTAPPPGFGSTPPCSSCYALGGELRVAQSSLKALNGLYSSLTRDHLKCSNYKEELDEMNKKCDEILKRCGELEEELESSKASAKRCAELEEELKASKASAKRCVELEEELKVIRASAKPLLKSLCEIRVDDVSCKSGKLNEAQEELTAEIQNPKALHKSSGRQDDHSTYNKKTERTFQREMRSCHPSVSNYEITPVHERNVPKENSSVLDGRNSFKNLNSLCGKREDYRQPKPKEVVKEIQGNLFHGSEDYSLAHCVGSDFVMSSGIAVEFRKRFRRIDALLDQCKAPGEVAFLPDGSNRYIYYLVTKLLSTGKPLWEHFCKAVHNLRQLCELHNVKYLAMPRIGCGLDLLSWPDVHALLSKEFADTDIDIRVYWKESEPRAEYLKWNLKLYNHAQPLAEIDPRRCAIVFFASTDGEVTPQMKELDKKFNFLPHFEAAGRAVGHLYHFKSRTGACLFGLMLKRQYSDLLSFTRMSESLTKLRKHMQQDNLYCIGLEAFEDSNHRNVMHKIWTLLIDVYFTEQYEVHFFWPGGVKEGWGEGFSS